MVAGFLLNNMNYYFTYSDENYIHIAERLFKSLQTYSSYKIIYYTINFDYDNKFDNCHFFNSRFRGSKFFNNEAYTTTIPAQLVKKFNCKIGYSDHTLPDKKMSNLTTAFLLQFLHT